MSLKEMTFWRFEDCYEGKGCYQERSYPDGSCRSSSGWKDNKIESLDDSGVLTVISKEIKKLKDVLPDFEKAGRQDLIDEVNKKVEVLDAYLPEQMSEDEINEVISAVINEVGAVSMKDMGKVMGAVKGKTAGRADNKTVSDLVKKALQSLWFI